MHEPLKNRTFLGKLFFNFLGANFLAPKSDHQREKQPVLGDGLIRETYFFSLKQNTIIWMLNNTKYEMVSFENGVILQLGSA